MEDRLIDFGLKDLVHYVYRDTLVPELFGLLGEDLALEVIQIFGGTKIVIPPYKKFLDMKRNLEIFENLSVCYSALVKCALARKYEITEVWVDELYRLMKSEVVKIRKFLESERGNARIDVTTERNPPREK